MPELPEVETIVRDLNKTVLKKTFFDVWTDSPKTIKKITFDRFKKEIIGKRIERVWRRGKNIIFDLSGEKYLLLHQKLTGHLLVGKWQLKNGKWLPLTQGPLEDPINRFIHLMFWLNNNTMMALSDLRKFAKVELLNKKELEKELEKIGAEPLDKNFNFEKFQNCLKNKKGKIKQVLMNQEVIAGIGNIYSDEILWRTKIHPFREVSSLNKNELKEIFLAIKKVLTKAIELGGESISDFRKLSGEKGQFDLERKVYQREGEKCFRCGTKIERLKIGGRSAHYCPKCQKI